MQPNLVLDSNLLFFCYCYSLIKYLKSNEVFLLFQNSAYVQWLQISYFINYFVYYGKLHVYLTMCLTGTAMTFPCRSWFNALVGDLPSAGY